MTLKNYFRLIAEGRNKGWEMAFWKPILNFGSWCYEFVANSRRSDYENGRKKSNTLPIPTISIGNITWGGVGKTPLTMYISRFLLNEHKTPLILTRGYGSDETKEYTEEIPQAILGIGKDRYKVATEILSKQKPHVAILDDGFQHWQLTRSLNIVVMNALNPFGNHRVIPSGILRERPEALKRADLIVFSDVNLVPRKALDEIKARVKTFAPQAEFVEAQREPLYFYWAKSKEKMELNRLKGKRVTTFSGVGTPRSFQLLMSSLGLKTVRNFEFCDHHPFSESELREIAEVRLSSQSDYLITTEKDYLRKEQMIADILNPLILKTALRITIGDSILKDRIRRLLGIKEPVKQKEPAVEANV